MNAEALIGTVLGTCTLQRLVGQGGMGAVYLAQQSRPRRQVAVKVLLPMTPLNPNQLAAFLERFRRETDAAASLEHPNIMPVHEYGEQDGIAYLVMPYISGGTLRDELEREGPLSLLKIVNYLEQMAAALDFAHEHGVIHRDIKPANIMITTEGRLLLSDFGLVKIISEGQEPQVRLTGAGAPVGTPDYMAPEQVIGDDIDTRADLYSLGIILYQMLTGTTPFQGETPMQIAAQHLQVPPPPPHLLRPELPDAAEQVVLQSLAKRPADRYMVALEMAFAFRSALVSSGVRLDAVQTWAGLLSASTSARMAVQRGQFEPIRQTAAVPKVTAADLAQRNAGRNNGNSLAMRSEILPTTAQNQQGIHKQQPAAQNDGIRPAGGGLLSRTGMVPSVAKNSVQEADQNKSQAGSGLLSRTGQFPMVGTGVIPTIKQGGGLLSKTGQFPMVGTGAMAPIKQNDTATSETGTGMFSSPWTKEPRTTAPRLQSAQWQGTEAGKAKASQTVKLNDPVKVVKVPVAGQPGQFVTGLLPFTKGEEDEINEKVGGKKKGQKLWLRISLIAALIIIVLGSVGTFLFIRSHPGSQIMNITQQSTSMQLKTTDPKALAQIQATATTQANVILSDPLDKNIHNWLTSPPNVYAFKNGAYHITDHGDTGAAVALPARTFDDPLAYTLTQQEVNGDDTNTKNSFGMIFRFSQTTKGGQKVTTFYSFEVVNVKGGEYQFWRYDDSNKDNAWTRINNETMLFGNEFHQGKAANTIKIFMQGNKFTVTVNGKALPKTFQDDALKTGTVGMIVNNNGTEVAYSNLLLTRS
jgi:serine/threonine protein kinase